MIKDCIYSFISLLTKTYCSLQQELSILFLYLKFLLEFELIITPSLVWFCIMLLYSLSQLIQNFSPLYFEWRLYSGKPHIYLGWEGLKSKNSKAWIWLSWTLDDTQSHYEQRNNCQVQCTCYNPSGHNRLLLTPELSFGHVGD